MFYCVPSKCSRSDKMSLTDLFSKSILSTQVFQNRKCCVVGWEGGMEGTTDIDLSEVFAHFWTEVGKKVGWWRLMAWHPKRRSL